MKVQSSKLEERVLKFIDLLDTQKKTFLDIVKNNELQGSDVSDSAEVLNSLEEYIKVFELENNLMETILEERVFMVVDLLDTQRKMFTDLVKNYDVHRAEDYDATEMLTTLEEYVKVFELEHSMMQSINYTNIDVHTEEHQFFIQKMKHFRMELSVNNTTLYGTMLTFMKKWLISHMMKENISLKEEMLKFLTTTSQ